VPNVDPVRDGFGGGAACHVDQQNSLLVSGHFAPPVLHNSANEFFLGVVAFLMHGNFDRFSRFNQTNGWLYLYNVRRTIGMAKSNIEVKLYGTVENWRMDTISRNSYDWLVVAPLHECIN